MPQDTGFLADKLMKVTPSREEIYAAGNGVAEWLGFDAWVDVVVMQNPGHVAELRKMVASAS
jgi:hypothetical protein